MPETMTLTYRYRVKDRHAAELARQARAVNFVWNWCNERQKHALRWYMKWPSAFDLHALCKGASKELGLHSQTVQKVCTQYVTSRQAKHKPWLRWRSNKKSLGWVPFNTGAVKFKNGCFVFNGAAYKVWMSRPLPNGENTKIGAGSFSQDARGRWYINVSVEVPCAVAPIGTVALGMDLGIKTAAATSDGEIIAPANAFKRYEKKLAEAQRANKKHRVQALHAKITNTRKDYLHKKSTALVRRAAAIFIGDVSVKWLAQSNSAKTEHDSGLGMLKTMCAYKAMRQHVWFEVVDEKWTTQTCSVCKTIPPESPKGADDLGIREWTCSCCGTVHDRDINSARNILAVGLDRLAGGIPVL